MTPRVSVVVPTYNAPAFLAETLDAILAQTFEDFELVVVNDGSTGDTADRLAAITDRRLRVVTQANAGIGAARNRGIDESHGELIALCDHDDLWKPTKLAEQVRFMGTHAECVGCAVRYARSTSPGEAVFTPGTEDTGGIVARPLWQLAHGRVFLITSAIMARRSALSGLRYFTIPRCIEDTPLQLRLLCRGPFGIAGDDILMLYRVHADNYSAQADFFLNGVRLLRRLQRDGYFAECGGHRADLAAFISHLGRTATLRQIQAGRTAEAWRLYWQESRHQLADGAIKYLLATPAALGLPARWRPGRLGS